MSNSNNIRVLLGIQDQNITFEENCIEEGTLKGKTCKYVTGKLTYDPTYCKSCGIKNEDYIVIKNGTQMSRITLTITGIHPTYLGLKKQRFLCKACDSSFMAETSIVKNNCYISENTNTQVVIRSAEAQPLISIARDCCVSPTTVQRVITKEAKAFKPHHRHFQITCRLMNSSMQKARWSVHMLTQKQGTFLISLISVMAGR